MVVLVAIISQILFLSTFVVLNITAYIKAICSFLRKYFVVGEKGLEPLTLAGLVPKTSVSTNCTTRPYSYYILSTENRADMNGLPLLTNGEISRLPALRDGQNFVRESNALCVSRYRGNGG